MAKQRTPEHDAIKRANAAPERQTLFSWRRCWGHFTWPGKWSFYFNWKAFAVDAGVPKLAFHGPEFPESRFNFSITLRPFGVVCFWNQRRLFWIGDWRWKKTLFNRDW